MSPSIKSARYSLGSGIVIDEQINENLADTGLRNINLHDLGRDTARFVKDSSLLLLWNLDIRHDDD